MLIKFANNALLDDRRDKTLDEFWLHVIFFRQEVEDSLLPVEAGKIHFDEPRLRTSPIV